ncbi:hypothetical protein D3C75_667940 [compost metagenome]
MLGSDGRENPVLGLGQLAELTDIANLLGAHLGNKNLMGRPQMLSDGAGDAHRSVEALGCHEHAVLLGQDGM